MLIYSYLTTCLGGGSAGYVVVVAQDMWWWLRRICGGTGAGYVVGAIKNKANSAQLELELELSLAIYEWQGFCKYFLCKAISLKSTHLVLFIYFAQTPAL